MPIIVNGTTIPTGGDSIAVNGVKVGKVIANEVTVWEKVSSYSPPDSSICNYVSISGGSPDTCDEHECPRFSSSIWYSWDWNESLKTYVITPKSPFSKITASFTRHGGLVQPDAWGDAAWIRINGIYLGDDGTITASGASITVECYTYTEGGDGHWQTSIGCCMRNAVLS